MVVLSWGRGGVQMSQKIPIPEAVDTEFSAIDRGEEGQVLGSPGAQSADPGLFVGDGAYDLRQKRPQAPAGVGSRQGVQISFVASLGDFRSARQIGNPLAQGSEGFGSARITLLGSVYLDPGSIVDGRLDSKDAALFVVELDGVVVDGVLDPDALGPVLEVADDLAGEVSVDLAAEEAQDVRAPEAVDSVKDQGAVDPRQGLWSVEHQIRGPFALPQGPEVTGVERTQDCGQRWMISPGDTAQLALPADLSLRVGEALSARKVLYAGEAVITTFIGNVDPVELPGEPFATVDIDLHGKGEPGLQSGMHEPEHGVDPVGVQVLALGPVRADLGPLRVPVSIDLEARAGLDRGEHADQSLRDVITVGNGPGLSLFVDSARRQVHDWPPLLLGATQGCFQEPCRRLPQKCIAVLAEDPQHVEEQLKARRVNEIHQGAPEKQAIEPAQNSYDSILMACYKAMHSVPLLEERWIEQLPSYFRGDALSMNRHR